MIQKDKDPKDTSIQNTLGYQMQECKDTRITFTLYMDKRIQEIIEYIDTWT